MQQLVLMIHVIVAVALIVLVLLQQGKGAEMGAAFGSGASQTLFGSQGSGSFLLKITGLLAAIFFITSLALGYIAAHQGNQNSLQQHLNQLEQVKQPATSAPAQSVPAAGVPLKPVTPDQLNQQLQNKKDKPAKSKN